MNYPDLAEKVVVVTGAGTGIGLGIADMFAAQGSRVVGVGRTMGPLQEAMSKIVARGGDAIAVKADVSDEADVTAAVAAALDRYGRIDVLVNNAGFGPSEPAPIQDTKLAEWNSVVATTLTGAMLCAKHVSRHFIERQGGAIVNISSLAGKLPRLEASPYSASKAGLDQLTRVMALELAKHHIRANAVSPGTIRTEKLEAGLSRRGQSLERRISGNLEIFRSPIPLGRVGDPADIASAVMFLASDAASFITGQVLYVDGGAGII